MADFDKLWNYNDPAATEIQFREILSEKAPELGLSYYLQLLTQIARTYSLRGMFNEAYETLEKVKEQLPPDNDVAHVRYYLEYGRTLNSSGKRIDARIYFDKAKEIAESLKLDGYTVDAIHMLAIVSPPDLSARLNEEAILLAESSADPDANRWLGSLYNNLGWSYFDNKQFEKALSIFLRTLQWFENRQDHDRIFIAKWTVARALRALNEIDKAITIQLALFEESVSMGKVDGYVHEELGELFLLKNDEQKSPFHFQKAFELLSNDRYLQKNEKGRLERMKQLGKGGAI